MCEPIVPLYSAMKNILKKIIKRLFHPPFKSQKKQDTWVIFSALPFKRKGFFLDIAATDGVRKNNTYVLEKYFGWTGICIEPNPHFFEKLQKNRGCIVNDSILSDKKETVNFRIDNGELGGIIANDTDNKYKEGAEIISKQTKTLTEILQQYDAPKEIDYFSLDVEGAEERIIRSLDFDTYTFKCLTIERPTPLINKILFENGYLFVKNHRFDSFYIHNTLQKDRNMYLEEFEQVPPKNSKGFLSTP